MSNKEALRQFYKVEMNPEIDIYLPNAILTPVTEQSKDEINSWFEDEKILSWWNGNPTKSQEALDDFNFDQEFCYYVEGIKDYKNVKGYIQFCSAPTPKTSGAIKHLKMNLLILPNNRGHKPAVDILQSLSRHLWERGVGSIEINSNIKNTSLLIVLYKSLFVPSHEIELDLNNLEDEMPSLDMNLMLYNPEIAHPNFW